MRVLTRFFLLLPLVVFAAACDKNEAEPVKASGLSEQRQILSQGYSIGRTGGDFDALSC